jgi:hypothetical protein
MNCHECARVGIERPAVGVCRFCSVGLCKEHIVASFRSTVMPQYSCEHRPDREFAPPVRASVRATAQPVGVTR